MELDLPVCIHTGSGTPAVTAMFDLERNRQWSHSGFPPLHAFRDLVLNQIPDMFPKLRFGFIEASASWIPYLIHKLRRDNTKRWKASWQSPADLFDDCRFFVACEADEDIPYLIQYTGEGHLSHRLRLRPQRSCAEQAHLVTQMRAARRSAAESRGKDFMRQSENTLRDIMRLVKKPSFMTQTWKYPKVGD